MMMNKLSLAQKPTPLQKLERLSSHLGIELWIKRDDLTGDILTGGNKIRKLEYLYADAAAKGADTVLVSGGLQSNLVKTAAALAIKQGIRPVLVLLGKRPDQIKGNLFLDTLLDVAFRYVEGEHPNALESELNRLKAELEADGNRVYVIPLGASNGLGALGYMDAYREMREQALMQEVSFDWEFVSAGSGGTFAGIYLGHQTEGAKSKLVGVSPWLPSIEVKQRVQMCIDEALERLNQTRPVSGEDLIKIEEGYIGPGYGIPTRECAEAISLLARMEGILLDQTYTGKAMAGMLDYVRKGRIRPGQRVLFWHTGGSPALSLLDDKWTTLYND